MITFFVTSTVMIVSILVLRFLLKNHISFLVLYPLWGIVLLRLLIPVTLIESPASIMNLVSEIAENAEMIFLGNSGQSQEQKETAAVFEPEKEKALWNQQFFSPSEKNKEAENKIIKKERAKADVNVYRRNMLFKKIFGLRISQWAGIIWLCGSSFFFLCIFISNRLFYRKLYQNRKKAAVQEIEGMTGRKKIPVYITEYVKTACLIGVVRPIIYISPDIYHDQEHMEQVLAHEKMHVYHKDHIWTMFRTLCRILYWFDPFVWIAAFYAKQDAELACDEAVLRNGTEKERYAYGKMLIQMSSENKRKGFYIMTSMNSGKRNLKERIGMLTKVRKKGWQQIAGMLCVMVLLAGCGLTGRAQNRQDNVEQDSINNENAINTEKEQKEQKEQKEIEKMDSVDKIEETGYQMADKETVINLFQEFMKTEVGTRNEWVSLEEWNGKTEELYFSIQYLGADQVPCLLVTDPFGVIMKKYARKAMVYYYNQKEQKIELLTCISTIGSGYPLEVKDGQFLVTSGQHSQRVYDWGMEGDYSILKAKEMYGYGLYDEEQEGPVYMYSEIVWQVPLSIKQGETPYMENIDGYAENITQVEDLITEEQAKEFNEKYGYTYGAEIPFYHNTEKGWKKYKNAE